eukprot:Opistho-1_new@48114
MERALGVHRRLLALRGCLRHVQTGVIKLAGLLRAARPERELRVVDLARRGVFDGAKLRNRVVLVVGDGRGILRVRAARLVVVGVDGLSAVGRLSLSLGAHSRVVGPFLVCASLGRRIHWLVVLADAARTQGLLVGHCTQEDVLRLACLADTRGTPGGSCRDWVLVHGNPFRLVMPHLAGLATARVRRHAPVHKETDQCDDANAANGTADDGRHRRAAPSARGSRAHVAGGISIRIAIRARVATGAALVRDRGFGTFGRAALLVSLVAGARGCERRVIKLALCVCAAHHRARLARVVQDALRGVRLAIVVLHAVAAPVAVVRNAFLVLPAWLQVANFLFNAQPFFNQPVVGGARARRYGNVRGRQVARGDPVGLAGPRVAIRDKSAAPLVGGCVHVRIARALA